MEITEDKLLNGRVSIFQPKAGYRVAVDPVLLAAAIPAKQGDTILDLGVGTGAISLCVQARVGRCNIKGIDTNTTYLELAQKSVTHNNWDRNIQLHFGDVRKPPRVLQAASFDYVVANPPYYSEGEYSPSPNAGKTLAHGGLSGGLEDALADWVKCAKHFVKPEGAFFVIFPADEQETLLNLLKPHFSHIKLCQILPRVGLKAKRVLILAKNTGEKAEIEAEPVVLHNEDGGYTPEARAILWDMKAINI